MAAQDIHFRHCRLIYTAEYFLTSHLSICGLTIKHETNTIAGPCKCGHRTKRIWSLTTVFQERPLTQIRYTKDGDILFSVAKDQIICAWFSANGERLGTYHGHQGALWTVDIDPSTTLLASGAADNTVRLWDVRTGKCLKVWDFDTAVKRVEFSEDGTKLLAVTEKRMGFLGTIVVLDITVDVTAQQSDQRRMTITCDQSKATVAGWSYLSKYIIAGHEDGSVSQYDSKVGNHGSACTS